MVDTSQKLILQFRDQMRVEPLEAMPNAFWGGLTEVGTELWLDTGDIDAAGKLWNSSFAGLTTNNSLLNAEIQKGIYDDLIRQADDELAGMPPDEKVMEIAFILNGLHGLRLVDRFQATVSVELHTGLSHDIDRTVAYAQRFQALCPEKFLVKIPLTPSGLIAARRVKELGIRINFTLGFSARQNYVAAALAGPDFVNVFLGRINAYVADSKLGSGENAGERVTLASQHYLDEAGRLSGRKVRQIAASMRNGGQIASLAGTNVFTMPVKAARQALDTGDSKWESHRETEYEVKLNAEAEGIIPALWTITDALKDFADVISSAPPATAEELTDQAHASGVGDLFPRFSDEDRVHIASDGKIPLHSRWAERLAAGEVSVDALLNLAGLAAFTKDQEALDDRIRGLLK